MTDCLRTKNIWYESRQYNSSQSQVVATQDENLIYPLLREAQNYNVAVSKAVIPLNSIPLRQTNLPLKYYEVGLRQGNFTGTAFVRQINSNSNNFVWSLSGLLINKFQYNLISTTPVGSRDLSPFMNYAYFFLIDDYENAYVAGSATNASFPDTLYIISLTSTLLQSISLNNITSIYINGIQNLYIADEGETGAYVNVYSNQNGENSVSLTLLGTLTTAFDTSPLQTISWVNATLTNILVGHDGNVVSFYNNELVAISDFTIADFTNMTAANALNGDDTFIVANSSTIPDALYASQKASPNAIYDVENDTEIATGDIVSKVAVAEVGGAYYNFGVGTNSNLYYTDYPFIGNPALWTQATSTPALGNALCGNIKELYNITSTNQLLLLNGSGDVNNTWYTVANTLEPATGVTIIDMDYNPSTNKLITVGSDNKLYISNIPVSPIILTTFNAINKTVSRQISLNSPNANQLQTINKVDNTENYPSACAISSDGFYYFVVGASSIDISTRVAKYNPQNLSFTTPLATYNYGLANINSIAIVGNYLCVSQLSGTISIFTRDTTTLLHTETIAAAQIYGICAVNSTTRIAIAYITSIGALNSIVQIFDLTTFTPVSYYTVEDSNNNPTSINAITANLNDAPNGVATIFVGTVTQAGNAQFQKLTYTSGFASVSNKTVIREVPIANVIDITCNSNLGLVAICYSLLSQGEFVEFYQQGNGYATELTLFEDPLEYTTGLILAPSIDLVNVFTEIDTGTTLSNSVAISRTSTNKLYTIANPSSTVYSGILNNNACDLQEISDYATQNDYGYISTIVNTEPAQNTTLRTFSISSQQQLGNIDLTNITIRSIAKNEINQVQSGLGEFLVPTIGQITSYSPALVQNYQLSQTTDGIIFAKNGEDIDAGAVAIYSYSVLINAINVAFQEAYIRLKQNNPNPLAEAPSIALDYTTKLCTLTYSADYTTSLDNGIYFNNPLIQLITFQPNIPSSVPALPNMVQIILPPNSTSLSQTSGTIYQFNLLLRIGIQSNTIYIADSYFGNNQTNRIISTIDVPTDEYLENNTTLYYQPTFMRPYQLASSNAINRIQVDILYLYKDFTSYPLLLNAGQCWSVQFDFIEK